MKYESLPSYCFFNPSKSEDRPAQPQQALSEVLKYQNLNDKVTASLMGEYNTWYKTGVSYGKDRSLLFKHQHRCNPTQHCGFTNVTDDPEEDSESSESPFACKKNIEESREICIFFCRGYCQKAEKCRFAHRLPPQNNKNPFQKIEKNPSKKLVITNFDEEDALNRCRAVCEEYGEISEISHDATRGELLVEFTSLSSAVFARAALHGCNFDLAGEELIVQYDNQNQSKCRRS